MDTKIAIGNLNGHYLRPETMSENNNHSNNNIKFIAHTTNKTSRVIECNNNKQNGINCNNNNNDDDDDDVNSNDDGDCLTPLTFTDDVIRQAKRRVFSFLCVKLAIGFVLCRMASMAVNEMHNRWLLWLGALCTMTLALALATWCHWIRSRKWALIVCLMITIKSMTSLMSAPALGMAGHSLAMLVLINSCLTSAVYTLMTLVRSLKPCLRNDLIVTCSMNCLTLPDILYHILQQQPQHYNGPSDGGRFLVMSYSFIVAIFMAVMFDHVLHYANRKYIIDGNFLQLIVYMLLPVPLITGYPLFSDLIYYIISKL